MKSLVSTQALSLSAWHHIALVRVGGVLTIYIDGVASVVGAMSAGASSNTYAYFAYGNGYIDDFRFTRAARYVGDFVVPATQHPDAGATLDYDWYWDKTLLSVHGGNFGSYDKIWADGSTNRYQVTKYNTAITYSETLSPFPGQSPSYVLDSTTGATLPNGSGNIDTGAFCIELWVNPNRFTASGAYGTTAVQLVNNRYWQTGNNSGWQLYLDNTGHVVMIVGDGAYNTQPVVFTAPTSLTLSSWNHVAVSRDSSNVLRCFINGALVWSGTYAGSLNRNYNAAGPWPLRIGYIISDGTYYQGLDGKMSNIRIVTGDPVYTSTFTVPTVPLTAIAGTTVLVASEVTGTRTNSTFIDSSSSALAISRVGQVCQGSVRPFIGANSAYFDGNGDYLQVPSSTNMSLASGDFTIETWVNRTAADATLGKYPRIINASDTWNTANSWTLTAGHYDWGWDKFGFHVYAQNANVSQMLQSQTTIKNGVWYHVAVTRQGNTFRMFVNGVLEATATWSGAMNTGTTNTARIGGLALSGGNNDFFNGFLSNLRVVKGTALYTTNFTPALSTLTAVSGTSLLLKFEAASIVDATRLHNIEASGDAVLSISTRHSGVGSIYFDGNGDYLSIPYQDFDFGLSDFTLEAWVYPTAFATYQDVIGRRQNGSTGGGYLLAIASGVPKLYIASNSSTWDIANGTGSLSISLNTWSHLAIVRCNNMFKLFVNGQISATAISTASLPAGSTLPLTIGAGADASEPYTGYMDDIRVTRAARYLNAFSPKVSEFSDLLLPSPITTDAYLDQVVTLMPFTTNLLDAKGATFNSTGSPSIVVSGPYGNCLNLDGTSYLKSAATLSNLNFGNRDFTIELWINPTAWSTSGASSLFGTRNGPGNSGFNLILNTAHTIGFSYFTENTDSNVVSLVGTTVIALNTWYHIAVAKIGQMLMLFVNGKLEAMARTSLAMYSSTGYTHIGVHTYSGSTDLTWAFNGRMYGLRATANYARYTNTFTPAALITSPVTGLTYDPYWSNVTLLVDGKSTSDLKGHSVTVTGTASTSTSIAKFNGSSLYFNGTDTKLTFGASADWYLGNTYTIDFWMYPTAAPTVECRLLLIGGNGSTSALDLGYHSDGSLGVYFPASGVTNLASPAGMIALNTWTHVAVCVQNGIATIYKNGVAVATGPVSIQAYSATNTLILGYDTTATVNAKYTGYLQDFRITNGVARYLGNFALPTSANIAAGASF